MRLSDLNESMTDFSFITQEPSDELVLSDIPIGVEIEVERIGNVSLTARKKLYPFWLEERDGSLKEGGREFKFSQAFVGKDVISALENFYDSFGHTLTSKNFTRRTSVHVHLDVARLVTRENLSKLVELYCIFERTLFKYGGPERYDSIFCVPLAKLWDHPSNVSNLNRNSPLLNSNIYKYAAVNLANIRGIGTIEFRMRHGTGDLNELKEWINILLCLYKAARSPDVDVAALIRGVSGDNIEELLYQIFGEFAGSLMPYMTREDLIDGARVAQMYHLDPLVNGAVLADPAFGGMFTDIFGDKITAHSIVNGIYI